jgi:hypothetical protein
MVIQACASAIDSFEALDDEIRALSAGRWRGQRGGPACSPVSQLTSFEYLPDC